MLIRAKDQSLEPTAGKQEAGNMRLTYSVVLAMIVTVIAMAATATAAAPQLINYQGRLTDAVGAPVDTTVDLTFFMCSDSLCGTIIWAETQPLVTIASGLFSVLLGSISPLGETVFDGNARWLTTRIGAGPQTTKPVPIVSVAYAYQSMRCDTANYALAGAGGGGLTLPFSGSVSSSGTSFSVTQSGTGGGGMFKISNTANTKDGINGSTNGTGAGVYGKGKRTYGYLGKYEYGVYAKNDSSGYSAYLAGDTISVYGAQSASGNIGFLGSQFYGAYAQHGASGNFGFLGNYEYGVWGEHGSSGAYGYLGGTGAAVYGSFTGGGSGSLGTAQYGVNGHATETHDIAVYGLHQLGNKGYLGGSDYGVYGYGNGSGRFGVYGANYRDSAIGYLGGAENAVHGIMTSTNKNSNAVKAENSGGGFGVYATSNGTGANPAAVLAWNTAGGWAIRANGPSWLNGTVLIQDSLKVQNSTKISGNLEVTGTINAPFPTPAYNSGWFHLGTNEDTVLTHNLGGDHRDYFVDLQFMEDSDHTLNNRAVGVDIFSVVGVLQADGARYYGLGPSTITVFKEMNANSCDSLRVRIWKVK